MIIGVDAGALGIRDERLKVGVYRVAFNVLRALGSMDSQNRYRLYTFYPIAADVLAKFGPNMENRVLKPVGGWFTVRLPIEIAVRPVDVFLGLSQALPKGSGRKIGLIHDIGFLHYPEFYPGSAEKLRRQTENTIRCANVLIAVSKTVKSEICSLFGVLESRVVVAYNGVDDRFTPKGPRYRVKHPYFLFVGALKRGKNIPMILRAFAQFLHKSNTKYDLLLVGSDYWLDPEIKPAIEALKLSPRVKFLGFVSDEDLPMYYRGAVALVTPSLVEGFCLPAVEAMACGTPVIGSTTGSFPEVVGEAGILVDPKDEKALTRAFISVATNSKVRNKFSQRAITQAKRFRWETFAKLVYKLL